MGKSVYKQLLIDECAAISEARSTPCRVEYPCTDQTPAMVTCCDGMVLLNRVGNVMSKPTKLGEYTDDGYPMFATPTPTETEDEPDFSTDAEDFALLLAAAPVVGAKPKSKYGTWAHMMSAIERELNTSFKRPSARVVVLGFDKKQFVDGVKRVTHAKRSADRIKAREDQIKKDTDLGQTPTRGIPFTFESIKDNALVPYPWSATLHGPGQCAALIRYITLKLLRFYKPPHQGQVLIIDGHCLTVADAVFPSATQEELDTVPVLLFDKHQYALEHMLRNHIGEFDHTAFFYVRRLATDPGVQFVCKLDPLQARSAQMHIRTNDTDTLVIALGFLERLAEREPSAAELEVVMEIPRREHVKVDMCINAKRMLGLLTLQYGDVLKWPGAYFAYGLSAKENDYTEMFMPGIGHATFMGALVNYPYAIGDLVGPRTSVPGPPVDPDAEASESEGDDSSPPADAALVPSTPTTQLQLATPDSNDDQGTALKRKRDDAVEQEPPRKQLCLDLTSSDDEQDTGPKRKREDDEQEPPSKRARTEPMAGDRAFQVREDAMTRFVAACYYEGTMYRNKKQRDAREKRKREGKFDRLDPTLLSHELIEAARKRRKMGGITLADLREKTLRHDYFVALIEDLTLGLPTRTIPFSSAQYCGYSGPEYKNLFK